MGEAARQVLEQALSLSEAEREQIAQQLLESLVDPSVEAAWTEDVGPSPVRCSSCSNR